MPFISMQSLLEYCCRLSKAVWRLYMSSSLLLNLSSSSLIDLLASATCFFVVWVTFLRLSYSLYSHCCELSISSIFDDSFFISARRIAKTDSNSALILGSSLDSQSFVKESTVKLLELGIILQRHKNTSVLSRG
jgi:FlaA1/EpsC-like NDP-sugar epimerase